jgi:RNA polymerase sigma-70 factor (ECF subfamily)
MKRNFPLSGEAGGIPLIGDGLMPGDVPRGPEAALASLIERAASGDAAAFDELMIHSQQKVMTVSWRLLGNEEDARDAAQETFLRVYKYLGSYRRDEDFFGWLYRITVNVCRDMERRRGIRKDQLTSLESEEEAGTLEHPAGADDALDQTLLAQRRAMVARAMATLPAKERAAVVLRDFEGLSTEEVARIMGTRPATVRVQISSARTKIKQYCMRLLKRTRGARG